MHDNKLMRIEVKHEGMNQSGIYLVDHPGD